MSMFRSFSLAVQATFNTITKTVKAVDESVDIAYNTVSDYHYRQTTVSKQNMLLDVTRDLEQINIALSADANLKEQFDKVKADYEAYRTKDLTEV